MFSHLYRLQISDWLEMWRGEKSVAADRFEPYFNTPLPLPKTMSPPIRPGLYCYRQSRHLRIFVVPE